MPTNAVIEVTPESDTESYLSSPLNPRNELKLSPKESALLEVLCDPDNIKIPAKDKWKLAGCSEGTYYRCLRTPSFLKALRYRNMASVVTASPAMIKRATQDGLNGGFMQQRMLLEMSGDYTPRSTPLVQQVIFQNNEQKPAEELDQAIINKLMQGR